MMYLVNLAVLLLSSTACLTSAGDVFVLKTPKGFQVDPKIPMKQNDIASFLFRSFGISESADCSWPGLTQHNPFANTKRAIVVAIPSTTADKDFVDIPGKKIPLTSGFNPEAIVFALDRPLSAVFGARAGVELIEQAAIPASKAFQPPPTSLNASATSVAQFVDELSALSALPSVVFNSQSPAKVFVFAFDTLDALGKREEIAEGRRLIGAVLREITEESDATVLAVSYSPVAGGKPRTKREASSAPAAGADYDYIVPFNLILWLSLVLFFVTLAVAVGIGGMDPGRDSIIYRMTNPRQKKDQ